MESVTDARLEELVERARSGEEEALTELLQAHTQRLLESVRQELGDRLRQRLESQDVMQQVYLDALRSIEQFEYRGKESFYHWLRRIAVNRICDADRKAFQTRKRGGEMRSADIRRDASMQGLLEAIGAPSETPSMVVREAERGKLLARALEELRADHREVLELRYFQQLNVAQTAAKMGRSERAVRSLCVRALIHLRELLGDAV
ncbi:MAG: sigma-70 family RNA polymerase sigma factor [Phycisphaerales bacterium JB038]